jgi:hypothetical protein
LRICKKQILFSPAKFAVGERKNADNKKIRLNLPQEEDKKKVLMHFCFTHCKTEGGDGGEEKRERGQLERQRVRKMGGKIV